jgi:hypothetical protein
VKCGDLSFELVEAAVADAEYSLYFVQCAMCGGVVGVQEFNNIGAMLAEQNEALRRIGRALSIDINL